MLNSMSSASVVSIALGDGAMFVVAGLSRKDPVQRLTLQSGDLVWFGGPARLVFRSVEAIRQRATGTALATAVAPTENVPC